MLFNTFTKINTQIFQQQSIETKETVSILRVEVQIDASIKLEIYFSKRMFSKWAKNTLDPQLSTKSIPCDVEVPDLNKRLAQYFTKTFDVYQKLFTIIKSESSFYSHPQPLRHPLIFYYGHTASFYINKLIDGGVIKEHVNEAYQRTFAVGVDENDWDDLDESHYQWPTLQEANEFRGQVKKVILQAIKNNQEKMITHKSKMWSLSMGIDHERIHLQTAAVIIRRLPAQQVTTRQWTKECPFMRDHPSKVPINRMNIVPKTDYLYDKTIDKANYYGWDCEFGTRRIQTKQFKASKMLVSNAEFFQFFRDNGYQNMEYWTLEGKKWIKANKIQKPVFWIIHNGDRNNLKNYQLKALISQIPMPWDWPVEVNNLEARAFCNWKSNKTGKKLRLPTEDEYLAMRNLLKADYQNWKYQSVGNINLQFWCSPCPVDMFEIEGFCDIIGNVMQHTCTPLYPFQNFEIHPFYEDFTTPCLDSRHDIIKGGCFMNTGNSASMNYRTAFRRHFYLFSGFRYVDSDNNEEISQNSICQSDQSLKEALKLHFLSKGSYIERVLEFLQKNKNQMVGKSLVVGCSVGRLPLELSKYFDISFGIDYTARYFQMAARLREKGEISYQGTKVELKNLQITNDLLKKVRLYQMNPVNTDKNKINEISFMIIDGFNLKKNTIKEVMKNCFNLFKEGIKCHALIICTQENNLDDDGKEIKSIQSPRDEIKIKDCFDVENNRFESESEYKKTTRIYLLEVQVNKD